MFPHEREAKVTLRKQQTRRRTPTPDEQDLELTREAKKVVSLGGDFIEQYQKSISTEEFNNKVKAGINRVALENKEKRAHDAMKREAYQEVIRQKLTAEDQSIDAGLSSRGKGSLKKKSTPMQS